MLLSFIELPLYALWRFLPSIKCASLPISVSIMKGLHVYYKDDIVSDLKMVGMGCD